MDPQVNKIGSDLSIGTLMNAPFRISSRNCLVEVAAFSAEVHLVSQDPRKAKISFTVYTSPSKIFTKARQPNLHLLAMSSVPNVMDAVGRMAPYGVAGHVMDVVSG